MAIPIIIDCDPGHDDAIAILLALASPEVEVLALTTVGGNSGLANTTRNALQVLEVAGRTDIPVAAGCERPLLRPLRIADHVHGASGLEGPRLEPPGTTPVDHHAVDLMAELLITRAEPPILVAVGPLTNIALLLRRHPGVSTRIDRIVLMGGAIGLGNRTPSAEFNILSDPEAADIVFRSGLDLTMMGLDVTHQARLGPAHGERLRRRGRAGALVADLLDFYGRFHQRTYDMDSSPIHDAVAVAELVWSDLIESESLWVGIETHSELTLGRTVVDRWRVTDREPNARVGLTLDGNRFAELVVERIGSLD